jgi:hypothetical protein
MKYLVNYRTPFVPHQISVLLKKLINIYLYSLVTFESKVKFNSSFYLSNRPRK